MNVLHQSRSESLQIFLMKWLSYIPNIYFLKFVKLYSGFGWSDGNRIGYNNFFQFSIKVLWGTKVWNYTNVICLAIEFWAVPVGLYYHIALLAIEITICLMYMQWLCTVTVNSDCMQWLYTVTVNSDCIQGMWLCTVIVSSDCITVISKSDSIQSL